MSKPEQCPTCNAPAVEDVGNNSDYTGIEKFYYWCTNCGSFIRDDGSLTIEAPAIWYGREVEAVPEPARPHDLPENGQHYHGWVIFSPYRSLRFLAIGDDTHGAEEITGMGCTVVVKLGDGYFPSEAAALAHFKPQAGPVFDTVRLWVANEVNNSSPRA